jgi:GNAT superfamily N-acetyltransferase
MVHWRPRQDEQAGSGRWRMASSLSEGFEGPRACGPNDLASALDNLNLVMRVLGKTPGGPALPPTFGYDYTHIYNLDNLDNVRVVLHDGRVVSSVGIHPTTVRTPRGDVSVGGINGVATHPDFRRHGLATATLADAHAKMRQNGHHIGLLGTGIQDYYRKLGWESAGRQRRFVFDRGNTAFLADPHGLDVTEEWRPRLDELRALRDAEPLGARRSPWLFRLLATRKLDRVFVARRGGRPVAYAGARGTAVVEYAGGAADVAALLRGLFERLDDPSVRTSDRVAGRSALVEMTVTTPDTAEGLPGLLVGRGIPSTLAYLGMIKLLDPEGLLAALGLAGEVALEGRDGCWRVRCGGRTLDLGERQLVKLFFGPERFPALAPGVFPLDFYQWPLDRV